MKLTQIQPVQNCISIDSWKEYQRDGEQFISVARRAIEKHNSRFTPEILYNLIAMGIEKLIMAFLMKRGDLAENHTMGDLLYSLQKHLGKLEELQEDFAYLDSFQEICELANYKRKAPALVEISRILKIGEKVQLKLACHM